MKKIFTLIIVVCLTLSASAQGQKSIEEAAKLLHLSPKQVTEIKALANERNQKIGEVKKQKLKPDVEKEKVQEVMDFYFPKIDAVLGDSKVGEWNAYWRK